MKTIHANLPYHLPRRALTSRKRKSLNDARQMLKKGFQVDAYEERSILVNHIYIAEILASFGEDRFLLSKGKLRIILEKKTLPNICHCKIYKKFSFF